MICGTFLARALIEFKINVFYVGATLSTKIKGSQRLSRQEEKLPMSLGRGGGVAGPEGGWLDGRKGAGRMLLLWQWQQGATQAAERTHRQKLQSHLSS